MKMIMRGIISFTGIITVGYVLSRCIDNNIDGVIIASGLTLVGFFVGAVFDINILKGKK